MTELFIQILLNSRIFPIRINWEKVQGNLFTQILEKEQIRKNRGTSKPTDSFKYHIRFAYVSGMINFAD